MFSQTFSKYLELTKPRITFMVLIATGTNTASRKIVAPLQEKVYLVVNNTTGGYDITVGGSTGSTATIPNGTSGWVFCNGTNFYNIKVELSTNFRTLKYVEVVRNTKQDELKKLESNNVGE